MNSRDRDLIGRIEYGRRRPARSSACRASASAGKRSVSGASKVKLADLGQIEALRRPVDPPRPRKAMRDRNAHVGGAELRHHRAVAEFDHPMHDRLRMHEHLDFVGRQREQMMRLDQLPGLCSSWSRSRW